MKAQMTVLLLWTIVLTTISCSFFKKNVHHFLNENAVRWEVECANSYVLQEKDTIVVIPGLDGDIVKEAMSRGLWRKNLELRSAIEKPKAVFQTKHMGWINSIKGYKCSCWLFYAMAAVCFIGFLLPYLFVVIRRKWNKTSLWFNNLLPIVVVLLTIMEAVYLFLFNYTIPLLFNICDFCRCVFNMLCAVVILLTQTFSSALYAEHLAMKNGSDSKAWGGYVCWSWILAIVGAFFDRYIGAFLQTITLYIGIVTFFFTLINNRQEKTVMACIYTVTMLIFPWVFGRFLSCSLMLVLAVLLR